MEQYAKFVRRIVDRRNRLVREKLAGEYPHLRALPPAPVEYSYSARVLKWSTIRVDSRSVPWSSTCGCTPRSSSGASWTGATGWSGRSWRASIRTCARCHPLRFPSMREEAQDVSYTARVLKWSTIRVDSRTYSVPSRLIGVMVDVRLYPDHVEVYYKGQSSPLVESMERIRGKGKARIDYRHIIGSLVRKPGAFARYRFREQLYPTHTFRLARKPHTYDAMCGWKGERADVDYVRILHLAATTMECEVERALKRLLQSKVRFDYPVVSPVRSRASSCIRRRAGVS